MNRLALLLCLVCLYPFQAQAQTPELSKFAKISVLTCGPGDELYSSFGHSAVRVHDQALGIDAVYNYGVFDPSGPNFYLNFTKGKMRYRLARYGFDDFLREYKIDKRWVKEQELALDQSDKQAYFNFLENNYKPENRSYWYHFFFDNCATRIRDGLQNVGQNRIVYDSTFIKNPYTFRELIRQNLPTNSWSCFGIDIALGSVIDQQAPAWDHLYLPAYFMAQLEHTTWKCQALVGPKKEILPEVPRDASGYFFKSPLFAFVLLFFLSLWFSIRNRKKNKRSRILDGLLFTLAGLAGCLIVFLWFFTDHTDTVNNLNILWAFPLHLIFGIVLFKRKLPAWTKAYAKFTLAGLAIAVVVWLLGLQIFSTVVIPIWATLALRCVFLLRSEANKS
ncbi:Lnb N-terminal periplasmic domain-containing protein [Sediminicola luteus]|uniref:Uncharacterized protein n=1 Tax=Sediminicola luteus TaxID=319238 RepID=A0A2A4G913_9FLAO|nr:DUF4105 domain-containing protein [Sediminicola luteus]PCE64901.1 hypothetical protein B7P33_06985 [Sediminicola luteus]